MKSIKVVAALIYKDNKILLAKRSSGDINILGKWEFPGGKLEPNETEEQAIEREMNEEFELIVKANKFITNTVFKYPEKIVDLKLYECSYISGNFHLHDHSEYKWVSLNEILNFDLAPADVPLAKYIKKLANEHEEKIDDGAKFVHNNIEKTLNLVNTHEEYRYLKNKVETEYNRIKYIKYTGNMYDHFLRFRDGTHKYAKEFSFLKEYGILPNENISEYLEYHYPEELDHYYDIEDLIIGRVYSNNEIANTFKCSTMGGMRKSNETNTLVLIAKHNNPLYDDQWTPNGILNYTGMGKTGNQSIDFSQNKTLETAKEEGIKVYLFESYVDNEYYYDGEVELAGAIYQDKEIDANGNLRSVIKFPLKRKDNKNNIEVDISDIEKSEKEKIKKVQKYTQHEIKEKAKAYEAKEVYSRMVKTVYRERSQIVSEYTKNRAKGICDLCGKEAPFKDRNGNPYLESHHVITLAENGPDAIYNTVAVCPNCHRKIHVLKSKKDIKKLEQVIYNYLLCDKDEENLKKWQKL